MGFLARKMDTYLLQWRCKSKFVEMSVSDKFVLIFSLAELIGTIWEA